MASTKKNFGYNLILTGCNYVFPLITYPYVSRVLGVDNIGICTYVDSIINYFILLSSLGIGSFGVREIARYKNDRGKRDEVYSNLLVANIVLTFVALALLWICTYNISILEKYKPFLGIGALKIGFNFLLTNWFFQGISDFKFITIRSVAVRLLYVFSVFLLVRQKDDVLVYYALTVLTIVVNGSVNWLYGSHLRKFKLREIHLRAYIKPILVFGFYLLLTSMYTTFNTFYLGYTHNDTEVGYFATATKLYTIVLSVFTALTTVLIPRVSQLLKEGNIDKIQFIASETVSLLLSFGIPLIVFCEFFAHEIVWLISGGGYEGAEIPFRIVIFLLIIIGLEQIFIQQFLMASQSNKSVLIISITGAVVGLLINFLLTPMLAAVGSAISWGVSEFAVLVIGIYFVKKNVGVRIDPRIFVKKLISIILYIMMMFMVFLIPFPVGLRFVVSLFAFSALFIIINICLDRNNIIHNTLKNMQNCLVKVCKTPIKLL